MCFKNAKPTTAETTSQSSCSDGLIISAMLDKNIPVHISRAQFV